MIFKPITKIGILSTTLLLAGVLTACQPIRPVDMAQPDQVNILPVRGNADVAETLRTLLGKQLQIDPATIAVVSSEKVEWPDPCLGVNLPTELCAQVITPGYKVTLTVNGATYILHTDESGYRYRLAAAPAANIAQPILTWSGVVDNGEAMEAVLSANGVAFGLAGRSEKIAGKFVSAARPAVLAAWAAQYVSFAAETDFGSIQFVGTGSETATPAVQQQIGRWAQIVTMEAAGGETLAGLRYEGPAEMGSLDTSKCAVLQLGASSSAGIGACNGTMTNQDMGKQRYLEWEHLRDRFAGFVYETATERITFEGMGNESSAAGQRAILAWARVTHAQLATGKTSATASTAMSWHLGPDPSQQNVCRQLTVLDYGYAYAAEVTCAGQEQIKATGGWLTSAELAQLDTWRYERAPLYNDQNYIDGKGVQEMSEGEVAEVNNWAQALQTRIWEQTALP